MPAIKIKWSSLLNLTELDFEPQPPKVLKVSDELLQAISWLTGATGHDRKLLRCTEQGALLVADPWSLLSAVEPKDITSDPAGDNDFEPEKVHKGILIATGLHPVKIDVYNSLEVVIETFYLPPAWLYWYPHPVYAVRRGRCMFPVGRFWTTLCTPELKYAFAHNHIKQVDTCVIYEQENIFRSYVDKFYSLRLDFKSAGVAEYEELCKTMLNSFYGKFGQKGENWRKIGDCPNERDREELVFNMGGRRVTKLRYLLGEIFIMTGHGESFDSFPAIAAHVTAYARIYLWSLMQQAGYGNYFYCDTDSLIVNEDGLCKLDELITPNKLGGLKKENIAQSVSIRGLKDYTFGSKNVIKGIRKNAIEVSKGVFQQEQWPSFRGLLRSGEPDTYTVGTTTKHLNREYTKGEV
ncbi:unnamed protein product, partial [marine sediment metagenome]